MIQEDNKVLKGILIIIIIILAIFVIKKYMPERYTKIQKDEQVRVNKNIEMTINSNRVTNKVNPTKAINRYSYYTVSGNQKYIDVTANISNISNKKINLDETLKARIKIDKKECSSIIAVEDINGRDFLGNTDLESGESRVCHFATLLDNSLFNAGDVIELVIQVDNKKFKYSIDIVEKDEYTQESGSVVNVNYIGQKIENDLVIIPDNFNFKIAGYRFVKTIVPSNINGSYKYFSAAEDTVYLDMKLDVTNTSSKTVKQNELLGYITLIYNENYEFLFSKITESSDGSDLNNQTEYYDILPNQTVTYHIICEVPENVETSDGPLYANFYINGENYIYNIR